MALSEIKITPALWDNMGSISDISLELTHFNSLWTSELNLAQEAWPKKENWVSMILRSSQRMPILLYPKDIPLPE